MGGTTTELAAPEFTKADRAYLRANFLTLEQLCEGRDERPGEIQKLIDRGLLPGPSYVVGGVGMFPADYFRLHDEAGGPKRLRELFESRYAAAARSYPAQATREATHQAWQAYLGGVWGQCLREVTPETIVRKRVLVDSLCKLIALPRPRQPEWQNQLRADVEELDRIEREFAPDYDRAEGWNDRPPTRDLLIEEARRRFPEVFADSRRAPRKTLQQSVAS